MAELPPIPPPPPPLPIPPPVKPAGKVATAATALVKDQVKNEVIERTKAAIWAWFMKALPAIAVSTVVGAVAGGVTAAIVADPPASKSAGRGSGNGDDESPGPVDFAAAGVSQGSLTVTSEPTGARVTLDGRIVGDAPLDRLFVDPGKHAVVAQLGGYQPFVTSVEVADGKPTTVNAILVQEAVASKSKTASRGGGARAPAKPWLNCSGKKQECENRCGSLEFSCTGRCHCQDKPQDVCKEITDNCRSVCKENRISCESGCDSAKDQCDEMSGPP